MVDVGHPFGLQFLPQLTVEQQVAALAHRAPMLGPAGLPTPRCDADVEVAIDGVGAALAENMLVEDERVTRSRRITGDRISSPACCCFPDLCSSLPIDTFRFPSRMPFFGSSNFPPLLLSS